jgi:murein DD-endopeptidase MepM/ murein hydrolase activator NlpD
LRTKRIAVNLLVLVALGALTWWIAGERIRAGWPRLLQPLSPHEQYARALEHANLHTTAMGRDWLAAGSTALRVPRDASAPFSVEVTFDAAAPAAVAWRFRVARGRRIETEVEFDGSGKLFVDLFHQDTDGLIRVNSAAAASRAVNYEPAEDGTYVVRVQPELLRGGRYTVRQRALATLQFPVRGVSARAVRSVFGDERDRGVRVHEGVDIFAPHGTPALAAADGWITRVTTNRLGGNVVWLWDAERGQALYYAHLDRQEVSSGTRVKAGDVIGRVGNTGNARTTPPHLHFGIYRAIEGAIDPLPFICDAPCGERGMAYAR